jgi:chromosome partitioning protein
MRRVVFNQKGGVGKSSITVNLAAISAARGYRTLVIDLDPQSNSTQYLMGEKAISGHNAAVLQPNIETFFQETLSGSPGKGLFGSALGSLLKSNERGLDSVVHSTPFENLWVIPSSPTLGAIEHALESKHKIFKLRDGLNDLSNQYDRIFIDTPPAFNFFTLSALIAANRVVIPFDCDVFSHRALLTLLENVIEAKSDHNARLEVEGIIVNQFQSQAKLPQQVVQGLKDEGLPVFESMLPASILMKESHQKSQPLIHLSPEHKLTLAYVSLFDEIEGQA